MSHAAMTVALLGAALASGPGQAGEKGGNVSVDLAASVGREVVVEGRVSRVPWQHIILSRPGKSPDYFDPDQGSQLVVYSSSPLPPIGRLRLTGTVLRVAGGSKRPGTKIDDPSYVEYHLDVTSWVAIPDGAAAERLLDRLADPDLAEPEKQGVERELVALGTEAIPVLIAHLEDDRTRGTERVILNEGELTNRAPNAPPLEPVTRDVPVPLGAACRRLLYRIVTPQLPAAPAAPRKPRSLDRDAWVFEIPDWPGWWSRNGHKPLPVLHDELRPVVEKALASPGERVVVR